MVTKGILSILADVVRRDGPNPGLAEPEDVLPYLIDHLVGRLSGFPRSGTTAPGRGDLEQHLRRVTFHFAQSARLTQRLGEATHLIGEAEVDGLGASPDAAPCYAFEVRPSHPPSARDAVLELVVDKTYLSLQDP
jgi:hypothetical protein